MNREKLEKARAGKPFKIADIVVYVFALVITVAVLVASCGRPGEAVEISVDGKRFVYSLHEDRVIDAGALKVVISDGKVWVEDAECPDKLCEKTGKIAYGNQTIVCLPGNIVIRITDSEITASTGQQ